TALLAFRRTTGRPLQCQQRRADSAFGRVRPLRRTTVPPTSPSGALPVWRRGTPRVFAELTSPHQVDLAGRWPGAP
ncbi:hypothetical protein B7486_54010, partial [cyanobacterium TDX16]